MSEEANKALILMESDFTSREAFDKTLSYLTELNEAIGIQNKQLTAANKRIGELEEDRDLMARKFEEDFDNAVDFYLENTARGKIIQYQQDLTKARADVDRLTELAKQYRVLTRVYVNPLLNPHANERAIDAGRQLDSYLATQQGEST